MENSERLGLSVAVVGHVALFAMLSLGIASRKELKMPVEPISVQLTDEVGLVSTAPNPTREAATATAPQIAPEIVKAAPEPEPAPLPPTRRPEPPAPKAIERPPQPKAAERPRPSPAAKPARASPPPPAKPQPEAAQKPKPAAPSNTDSRRRPDRPTPSAAAKAPRAPRIGSDFLEGVTDKPSTSRAQTPPASVAGPAVVASLQRELLRQVKPHWAPPSGADADKLRTRVTVRLDESGNIVGTPSASTSGVTASNRPQEALHKERAIAAVRRAAPFKFPPQFYAEWQTIEPTFYLGL